MSWKNVEKDVESGPLGLAKWIVVLVLFLGAIGWVFKPVDKAVERAVMKQSFQYKEGMEQRAAILQANIAEIDALIAQQPENREALSAQKRVLKAQLRAITINE